MIGLNGYTICSDVINEELNGPNIIAKPLNPPQSRLQYPRNFFRPSSGRSSFLPRPKEYSGTISR